MQINKKARKYGIVLLILFAVCPAYCSTTYFVATTGSDSNPGTTIDYPFLTIGKAVGLVAAGDTIYVRAGTYTYTNTTGSITLPAKSGTSDINRCSLIGYSGERALLDFSAMTGSSADGLKITGSYWYIKGIDCKGAPHNGIKISGGSYNILEFCSSYENWNSGVQLSSGASYNQFKNCDSYHNYDKYTTPNPGVNADGFSPKLNVGTGNYFYGCRSWGNSDDAYDGYLRPDTGGPNSVDTTYENCWAFKCGWYWKDGSTNDHMNGNGFKMGGGDSSNSAKLRHNVILKNCLSFQNKEKGFDQNNDKGSMTLLNCTAFNNGAANYNINVTLASIAKATITNCVYLTGGSNTLASWVVQTTNGWMSPFSTTSADFVSIDPNLAYGPRNADGSLPKIAFMRLAPGSDLIDGGTIDANLPLPYNGSAPDLGAFEYLPGDCHSDGQIDLLDLKCVADNWLSSSCGTCNWADFNGDNNVNFFDFAIMAENWMK